MSIKCGWVRKRKVCWSGQASCQWSGRSHKMEPVVRPHSKNWSLARPAKVIKTNRYPYHTSDVWSKIMTVNISKSIFNIKFVQVQMGETFNLRGGGGELGFLSVSYKKDIIMVPDATYCVTHNWASPSYKETKWSPYFGTDRKEPLRKPNRGLKNAVYERKKKAKPPKKRFLDLFQSHLLISTGPR